MSTSDTSSSSDTTAVAADEYAAQRRVRYFRRRRQAKRFLEEVNYPHSVHPALVPGVSVEDQKVRYGVDVPILVAVGVLIIAFVTWGVMARSTCWTPPAPRWDG